MPGTACADARSKDAFEGVVLDAAARVTRLDVAVDFPNGCSPSDFVAAGYNERFKARATLTSSEGKTEYVGSMKSDRYARVYQYAAPHPRAGVTRVEHVFRRDFAKNATAILLQDGLQMVVARAGNSFGWQSPSWLPETMTTDKLRSTRADRHEPGRVRWLYNVVMPALVKAHKQGLIDLPDFAQQALSLL